MPKAAIQFNTLLANGVIEPVAGAQVTINAAGTGDTVALFEDRDGNVGQNNPFFADADGQFLVYADGGRVDIIVDDGDGNVATAFDVQLVTGVDIDGDQWDFDQMPEVDGNPVVESGSNSDGEFVRFADGTQIAVQDATFDLSQTAFTAQNTFAPPVDFTGEHAPSVPAFVSTEDGLGNMADALQNCVARYDGGDSAFLFRGTTSTGTAVLRFTITGRWFE